MFDQRKYCANDSGDQSKKEEGSDDQLKKFIRMVDRNGDNKITRDEIESILRQKGISFPQLRAWVIRNRSDVDIRDKVIEGEIELRKLLECFKKNYPRVLEACLLTV